MTATLLGEGTETAAGSCCASVTALSAQLEHTFLVHACRSCFSFVLVCSIKSNPTDFRSPMLALVDCTCGHAAQWTVKKDMGPACASLGYLLRCACHKWKLRLAGDQPSQTQPDTCDAVQDAQVYTCACTRLQLALGHSMAQATAHGKLGMCNTQHHTRLHTCSFHCRQCILLLFHLFSSQAC